MRTPILALMLVAVAAPAIARDARIPDATPVGKPLDCVPVTQLRESRVRSDSVIDFYAFGNRVYRNTLPSACPQLGFERRFGYQLSTSQLCSVDIIHVLVEPGLERGASCGLGKFQPVTLAAAH